MVKLIFGEASLCVEEVLAMLIGLNQIWFPIESQRKISTNQGITFHDTLIPSRLQVFSKLFEECA